MAAKALGPRITPTRPFKIKWILVGPIGMWIRLATKKTAAITETFGISSRSIFRIVAAAITTVPPKPAAITGADKIPSAICMLTYLLLKSSFVI